MTWKKAIIMLVIGVILYFIIKKVWAHIKPPNYASAAYQAGGGSIPEGWSPTKITDDLYGAIEGWFDSITTKEAAFKQFNDLPTDNMKIAVHNDWRDRKSTLFHNYTLHQAVNGETNVVYFTFGAINEGATMIAHLERLGLS